MIKLIPVPIPINGLNTIDPTVPIESGYARELTNLFIANGRVMPRPACKVKHYHSSLSHVAAWFDTSTGTPYTIEFTGGLIRNVSTGFSSTNIGGNVSGLATMFKHNNIDILCGCREPRSPVGPTFTSHGFVLSKITDETTITAGCSHKGRPYFTNSAYVEYGDVGQVTGTFASDGLAGGYFDPLPYLDGQYVLRIFSVTVQQGNESDNVLVLFGTGGKVLIYSGDWPDSDNWQLVASYNMPKPASLVSFLEIDGDIMVATPEYCYWFRDLLNAGAISAYENRPSKPIQNLWQSLDWETTISDYRSAHIFYIKNLLNSDDENITNIDAIVFQSAYGAAPGEALGTMANYENYSVYLAYMRNTKSWALWLMTHFYSPVKQGLDANTLEALGSVGDIKTLTIGNLVDEYFSTGSTSVVDIDIECNWKTPLIQPFKGVEIAVKGVRLFFKNSISGFFNLIRTIYDFSDFGTKFAFATQDTSGSPLNPANSNSSGIDGSTISYGIYSTLTNPGGIGAGVSIQFNFQRKNGSSEDQIQEILGATILADDGGVLY